ncbi:hypothetical protein GE061_005522 [Apolygus lucorum]|uniref:Uncharacterized protein n=1 Tax=Apolygus lucorum TaxID=248454 RepID=A0A8S9X0G3_APOLU|nr:hypothetical protein GE061_005522 [Apolygus lucorum]
MSDRRNISPSRPSSPSGVSSLGSAINSKWSPSRHATVSQQTDKELRPKPPKRRLVDDDMDRGKTSFWSDFITRKDYYDEFDRRSDKH